MVQNNTGNAQVCLGLQAPMLPTLTFAPSPSLPHFPLSLPSLTSLPYLSSLTFPPSPSFPHLPTLTFPPSPSHPHLSSLSCTQLQKLKHGTGVSREHTLNLNHCMSLAAPPKLAPCHSHSILHINLVPMHCLHCVTQLMPPLWASMGHNSSIMPMLTPPPPADYRSAPMLVFFSVT